MKISIQSQSGNLQNFGAFLQKRPIALKILGNSLNLGIAADIRRMSPTTFIVLRTGGNWAVDDDAYIRRYADEASRLADPFLQAGLCDLLEPPNEPVVQTAELAKTLNFRQVQYASLMRARGYRVGAYNFSVGNPFDWLWQYLWDGVRASDGWLLLHEYGAPTMQANAADLGLRHRRVFELAPPDVRAMLKIGITETGIDLGAIGSAGGYRRMPEPPADRRIIDVFLDQLSWYDAELAKDPYVKFATLFGYGMNEPWTGLGFDLADVEEDRLAYIQWQQPGRVEMDNTPLPPPPPPPPTGATVITSQEIADSIAFTYSVANQWDLGEHRYGEVTKHAADGKDYIINLFAGGGVVVEKGHYAPGDAKYFDRKTFALSDKPPAGLPPVVTPPVGGLPYLFPTVLTAIGALGEEGQPIAGQPFYRLSGASVRTGISAFMIVTLIGKNGVPVVGAHVVNLFPDGNGEVIQTDGSGVVRYQFGASSAFTNPGSGPFTIFVADDSAFKDAESVPKRVVYKQRLSDVVKSLGDFQGTHTEIYLQFVAQ